MNIRRNQIFRKNSRSCTFTQIEWTSTYFPSGFPEIRSVIKLASGVQLGSVVLCSSLSEMSKTLSFVSEFKLCILISVTRFWEMSRLIKCGRGSIGSCLIPQLASLSIANLGRKWNSSYKHQKEQRLPHYIEKNPRKIHKCRKKHHKWIQSTHKNIHINTKHMLYVACSTVLANCSSFSIIKTGKKTIFYFFSLTLL